MKVPFNSGLQQDIWPLLDEWLGVSLRERKHPAPPPVNIEPPFGALYRQLEHNLSATRGVRWANTKNKNWRFEPQLENNSGGEKLLEKKIAKYMADWVNQVPTCSGYSDKHDAKRAIDLVQYLGPGHFKFIELKTVSNDAVYAAVELSLYGLTYLLARNHGAVWHGKPERQMLMANRVDLAVLAPKSFYSNYERALLHAFEQKLHAAIASFSARRRGPAMTFRYDVLPCETWDSTQTSPDAVRSLVAGIRPLF